ncbi:hypothetical protein [uncultured Dialister sp.]|nr:hypothetical protein [uncultured Dialister sp.]
MGNERICDTFYENRCIHYIKDYRTLKYSDCQKKKPMDNHGFSAIP